MRRREFIAAISGALAAWPLAARAQQPAMPVIGFLSSRMASERTSVLLDAFRHGLNEAGYVEGQTVAIEYRWAELRNDRLSAMAADLVRRQVAVIAAAGGTEVASVAQKATATIPIVFNTGGDPVRAGLVASLNRPGGNVTGVTPFTRQLGPKQLGLLHAMVPTATTIAVLVNQNNPDSEAQLRDVQEAAHALRMQILPLKIESERDFEAAFARLKHEGGGGLLVGGGAFYAVHRVQLADLAARHAVPAIYTLREFALAGGLMSYAASLVEAYHQVGVYVGRVLNGEKPADLPVLQPSRFQLVLNLKTAKALGLTVPPTLLALADEVIE